VGQIQPTEIMFISVSFNSSSQKYANFRVHTYPPREVNPFHTDHAGSVQSDLLLSPPPTFSSCRRPPTPRVLVEHAAASNRPPQCPTYGPTRPARALADCPACSTGAPPVRATPDQSSLADDPPPNTGHSCSAQAPSTAVGVHRVAPPSCSLMDSTEQHCPPTPRTSLATIAPSR
jgi:hypothetical protein